MRRRIFRAIFGACLCVLLLAVLGTVTVVYQRFFEEQIAALRSQARVSADLLNNDPNLPLEDLAAADLRVSVIDADGRVLYDSREDPSRMDNHRERREIVEASQSGEGFALRPSATLAEDTYNAAVRLKNGSYLRLSRPHSSFLRLLGQALIPMFFFVLAAVGLSWLVARIAARSIIAPINAIDPNSPKKLPGYEQLDPLLNKLEENRRQIRLQMEDLEQKNREFKLLSEHMDEGLVLFGPNRHVLFANQAALSTFPMLRTGRCDALPAPVCRLLHKAENRQRASKSLCLDRKTFHLEAHAIENSDRFLGFLLLILDVTEREEIKKQRQEFTANVTHELKTPLQTILSASELLQNGMIPAQDQAVFAGYIHSEAERMTEMINNIIHLSRLDSLSSAAEECVSFSDIVQAAAESIESIARLHHLSVHLDVEPVRIHGSGQLLDDIISCLLENAVLYNRDGGSIFISLHARDGQAILQVRDTGLGIDPSLHERVFERFYTADPSHNHHGTGLGLAIVRHAVQSMHGTIHLESALDQGSCFEVRLPLESPDPAPARDSSAAVPEASSSNASAEICTPPIKKAP